jgi:uncharacterized membrane protein YozB (DUF420 family)
LNAFLNGLSGVLLAGGYAAICNRKIAVHKTFMISAFLVSSVFRVPIGDLAGKTGEKQGTAKFGMLVSLSNN